jgi:hypothetical protein
MKLPLKPQSAGSAPRDRWQVGTEAWDWLMEKKIRCHPIQNWLVAWYLLLWTFHVTIPKEELMV